MLVEDALKVVKDSTEATKRLDATRHALWKLQREDGKKWSEIMTKIASAVVGQFLRRLSFSSRHEIKEDEVAEAYEAACDAIDLLDVGRVVVAIRDGVVTLEFPSPGNNYLCNSDAHLEPGGISEETITECMEYVVGCADTRGVLLRAKNAEIGAMRDKLEATISECDIQLAAANKEIAILKDQLINLKIGQRDGGDR